MEHLFEAILRKLLSGELTEKQALHSLFNYENQLNANLEARQSEQEPVLPEGLELVLNYGGLYANNMLDNDEWLKDIANDDKNENGNYTTIISLNKTIHGADAVEFAKKHLRNKHTSPISNSAKENQTIRSNNSAVIANMQKQIDSLNAQLANSDAVDAERYRWLTQPENWINADVSVDTMMLQDKELIHSKALEAVIDSELAIEKRKAMLDAAPIEP